MTIESLFLQLQSIVDDLLDDFENSRIEGEPGPQIRLLPGVNDRISIAIEILSIFSNGNLRKNEDMDQCLKDILKNISIRAKEWGDSEDSKRKSAMYKKIASRIDKLL